MSKTKTYYVDSEHKVHIRTFLEAKSKKEAEEKFEKYVYDRYNRGLFCGKVEDYVGDWGLDDFKIEEIGLADEDDDLDFYEDGEQA